MTGLNDLTPKQLATIRAALTVTLQVASRQQYGVCERPTLVDPQHVKELIRDVFDTIGYSEGTTFPD